MECQLCQHDAREEKRLCRRCEGTLKENLADIPALQSEAKVSWFQEERDQDRLHLRDQ